MVITRIRLHNYKSFHAPPELLFGPGFNVILGANNAGKTALLEGLSLTFSANPHRSPATIPRPGSAPAPKSTAELSIELSRSEFLNLLADHPRDYYVSHPDGMTIHDAAKQFLTSLTDSMTLDFVYDPQEGFPKAECAAWPVPDTSSAVFVLHTPSGSVEPLLRYQNLQSGTNRQERIFAVTAGLIRSRLYFFHAERMKIGEAQIGTDPTLAPNAANLPAV